MKPNLPWFDDDPKKTLSQKIANAAAVFQEQWGVVPDLCYANTQTLNGSQSTSFIPKGRGFVSVIVLKPGELGNDFFYLTVMEE